MKNNNGVNNGNDFGWSIALSQINDLLNNIFISDETKKRLYIWEKKLNDENFDSKEKYYLAKAIEFITVKIDNKERKQFILK